MTRILLVLVVLIALGAVLWSSWRLDRRLFVGVLVASVTLLVLFVGGFFRSQEQTFVAIPPEKVEIELLRWRALETGIRLEGRVYNGNDTAVARISGQALLLDCPGPDNCREKARTGFQLRQHVPPDTTYPFDTVLRLDAPLPDHPRWLFRIERVEGYTEKPSLVGRQETER